MNNGWIKLHRQIVEWEWYSDTNVVRVFLHCLLKANHEDNRWQGKVIKRGQFITGRQVFAAEVSLSQSVVYRAWKKLESTGELHIESNNKGTVVTICNYNTYQEKEFKTEQQTNNKRTTNEQQTNTNKNVKNVKNDKKEYTATELQAIDICNYLIDCICEWDSTHKYANNRPSIYATNWMKEIDRAIRIDGRTTEQLRFIIEAVFLENQSFTKLWDQWPNNIQSGKKLREKFDKIKNQIKESTHGNNQQSAADFARDLRELEQYSII